MEAEPDGGFGCERPRERTLSSMSQQSNQSSKYYFPLTTNDSGLYTCSSNNSEFLESDSDSYHLKLEGAKYDTLQLALREGRRLRSELERLSKSEQWYKQELRHQKSTRLEDLERIYAQERKFLQENQRLQKECLRLYEKCSELEKELEQRRRDLLEKKSKAESHLVRDVDMRQFEAQQQSAVIKDQLMLIEVLRNQKKALLDDLRGLTDNKDAKVTELQKLLADLEFDNKHIIKKCRDLSEQKLTLEHNLMQSDSKLSSALEEKLNLQKAVVELKEHLELQKKIVKQKEEEVAQLTAHFKKQMQNEIDPDEVHRLSVKYYEDINNKSLQIIALKNQLNSMQHEIETLQELQAQNDQQQRLIEQLSFSLEACKVELQEIKQSDVLKSTQLKELRNETDKLAQESKENHKMQQIQQEELNRVRQELKATKEQYALVQEHYKETNFKLELLEIDQGKLKFQRENDQLEIKQLREKLKEYLHQTSELSDKIQMLETELRKAMEDNAILRLDFEKAQKELNNAKTQEIPFAKQIQECGQQRSNLDIHSQTFIHSHLANELPAANNDEQTSSDVFHIQNQPTFTNVEGNDLILMSCKLQENTDLLRYIVNENKVIMVGLNSPQLSIEGLENLVKEKKILNKNPTQGKSEALSLQFTREINEMTQKSAIMEELFHIQKEKVLELQKKLVKNDGKLYKMERQMQILQLEENKRELQIENQVLRENLTIEQCQKDELSVKLTKAYAHVEELKTNLKQINTASRPISHKSIQCEAGHREEIELLKKQVLDLQEKERQFVETESKRKIERIQFLHQLSDMQNSKILCIQNSQKDWEDMLKSLKAVQEMDDESRKELELKRMELEELNRVFGEQNEELRKLEEFTAVIESKRIEEKEKLKKTFQQEIDMLRKELQERCLEVEEQRHLNHNLLKINEQMQKMYNNDYPMELSDHVNEIRSLKCKIKQSKNEKENMLEHIRELEDELRDIKSHQRQAVLLPQLRAPNNVDFTENQTDTTILKDNVTIDHMRILTKVIEAEYDRKMKRYDEHIHSLLTNVKSLKKSLKLNEEKTALISEEQSKTLEELKDFQKIKRKYEDMRLKYEQSQTTIQELKETLSTERKKFESSDLGKSSQNETSAYEVANLIDDYKKLIQQSASAMKRPPTSAVLDLIQRSNQCVPNLNKIESSLGDLRIDLQQFITSYTHKMPISSLINAASLTVPPSLMDELKVASEIF